MFEVQSTIEINLPVEQVWEQLSKLDDVEHWLDSVVSAHYHTAATAGVGAGRTCEVAGFGTLIEEAVEWKENEGFTLDIKGMPPVVKEATGAWRLERLADDRTLATTTMRLETRWGFVGSLLEALVLEPKLGKNVVGLQVQFKEYVEARRGGVRRAAA